MIKAFLKYTHSLVNFRQYLFLFFHMLIVLFILFRLKINLDLKDYIFSARKKL